MEKSDISRMQERIESIAFTNSEDREALEEWSGAMNEILHNMLARQDRLKLACKMAIAAMQASSENFNREINACRNALT